MNFIFGTPSIAANTGRAGPRPTEPTEPDGMDAVRRAEKEASEKAEAGQLEGALALLDAVLETVPETWRGSVHNNRAQVRRMTEDMAGAKADAAAAVAAVEAWQAAHAANQGSVAWGRQELALQNAHLQLVALAKHAGDSDAEQAHLRAAAAAGSAFASAALKNENPYATLCHTAVQEMMTQAGAHP